MCNRYALHYKHWQDFCDLMNREMPDDWRIRWPSGGWVVMGGNAPWPGNVYPKRLGLFLRRTDDVGLEPVVGHWGLVSPAEKGPLKAVKFAPNNARSEAVDKTFPFRFVMANRALIPMSNFVEWTGPKGSMTLHEISAADGAMLLAAGLWSQAETADGPVTSYTMLMQDTRDGDDCQPFHNRQPVILEHDDAMTWLDPAQDYRPLLRSPACGSLVIDPSEPAASNPKIAAPPRTERRMGRPAFALYQSGTRRRPEPYSDRQSAHHGGLTKPGSPGITMAVPSQLHHELGHDRGNENIDNWPTYDSADV